MRNRTFASSARQAPAQKLLLRPREAAAALGVSEKSLWLLMKSGRLPVVRIGKSTRYDMADLQAFIASSKVTTVN